MNSLKEYSLTSVSKVQTLTHQPDQLLGFLHGEAELKHAIAALRVRCREKEEHLPREEGGGGERGCCHTGKVRVGKERCCQLGR